MKDDPDFTLRFVGIIVANPCIYDHTISDYSYKHVIGSTWEAESLKLVSCFLVDS